MLFLMATLHFEWGKMPFLEGPSILICIKIQVFLLFLFSLNFNSFLRTLPCVVKCAVLIICVCVCARVRFFFFLLPLLLTLRSEYSFFFSLFLLSRLQGLMH